MLNEEWVYSRYFIWILGKDITISGQESNKLTFFGRRERSTYLKKLVFVVEENTIFVSSQGLGLGLFSCGEPESHSVDYYYGLEHLVGVFPFFSTFNIVCFTITVMHCLDATWSPLISITP